MENFKAGLRCHDIHGGLRNIDAPTSGPIVQYLEETRLTGMAAAVAVNIRGRDVIDDADALKVIAADQLGIEGFAFRPVLDLLQELGFVRVEQQGSRLIKIYETIPLHHSIFEDLGAHWHGERSTGIEEELVAVVDALADGPLPQEQMERRIGVERDDIPTLLRIGEGSEMIKRLESRDGEEILYSPLFSFERPEELQRIFENHESEDVREAFEKVKKYQGLPLLDTEEILNDAVGRGLLPAPAVRLPNGTELPFVCTTAGISRDFLTVKKSVLDRALAAIACVRCGENYGGASAIQSPKAILRALLDASRKYRLRPHSSHQRQYRLLRRLQVVRYIPSGSWVSVQLIDSEDNKEAIRLAIDLLEYGEPVRERGVDDDARKLIKAEGLYVPPIETLHARRPRVHLSDATWEALAEAARGGVPIEST